MISIEPDPIRKVQQDYHDVAAYLHTAQEALWSASAREQLCALPDGIRAAYDCGRLSSAIDEVVKTMASLIAQAQALALAIVAEDAQP